MKLELNKVYKDREGNQWKLVGVIGDDFKEEPFKIEFEGSILYSESTWNQETITVAAHKKADFNFEIAKFLQKLWSGVHNCKITIEEIVE